MLFKKLVLLIFIFLIGCTESDSVSGDVNNIKLEFIDVRLFRERPFEQEALLQS